MILRTYTQCTKCRIQLAGRAKACPYCGGECRKPVERPREWFMRDEPIDRSTANPIGGY